MKFDIQDGIDPNSDRAVFLFGRGGWPAFHRINYDIDRIFEAAVEWERALAGVEKPWLVWNAHEDWCFAQQNLIEKAGWTPVVGCDPRIGKPQKLTKTAVFHDFNKNLQLPFLHPVFVLEFAFLFADKLAFWHSDLLIHPKRMKKLAQMFSEIENGQTYAVKQWHLRRFWRKPTRAWELVGCTTRAASKHQFDVGSGWWCNTWAHINCSDIEESNYRKDNIYWDHGAGIKYWKDKYKGDLRYIDLSYVEKGHFSPTSFPHLFERIGDGKSRNLKEQLESQVGVRGACKKMNIDYDQLIADR